MLVDLGSQRKESGMGKRVKQAGVVAGALSALAVATAGLADAASTVTGHHASARTVRAGHPGGPGNPAETLLTGAALKSASSAAVAAVPGGSVERASIEDPSDASKATYEVHVSKADGSRVVVLEDAAFKVRSTTADHPAGGFGPGHGPGGPGGNPDEAALTGATAASAGAAAAAAVPGAKVDRATAEDKRETTGAVYEVHVTKADGSRATVLEDAAFKVLTVTAEPDHGPGGPGRGGPPMFGPGH
jgi:uncharacterized membrane protein YkoI